jgi:hypothetical protein
MTKEDVIAHGKSKGMEYILAKFFESNVCIQRGVNRHPYADVLHEWIEGAEMENRHNGIWNHRYSAIKTFIYNEYRIKPPEPVYEWQWHIKINGELFRTESFLTRDEIEKTTHFPFQTVDNTKRVRQ